MISEDRAEQIARLKRELLFHHERRKAVEGDTKLTAEERARYLR